MAEINPVIEAVGYLEGAATGALEVAGGIAAGYELVSGVRKYLKRKRMDTQMVNNEIAGDVSQINRCYVKRKLKSGKLRGKLAKLHETFVQRWQRIYPFGLNAIAYPAFAEEINTGVNGFNWPAVPSIATAVNSGRLALSHVAGSTGNIQLLPGYLFDITCWRNESNTYNPVPCKRFLINNSSNFLWQAVAQNYDNNLFYNDRANWGPESGPSGTGNPTSTEMSAILKWTDIRLSFNGNRKGCTRVIVEMVQFKESKYTFDFHPDGEAISAMSDLDRYDVNEFWANEFKRLTFHPSVVNTTNRKEALTVLYHDEFCINADNLQDADAAGPTVIKDVFKRFNRKVSWNWNKQAPNLSLAWSGANSGGMENPQFYKNDQGQLLGYANPKARIYLYIRAENFNPVGHDINMTNAYDREVTFDMIVRNKWIVQT